MFWENPVGNPKKKKKKIVGNGYKFPTSFIFYVNVNKSTIRLHFFFIISSMLIKFPKDQRLITILSIKYLNLNFLYY